MNFLNGLLQNDPKPDDDDDTQPITPPVFPLAGMGAMRAFLGPDGKEYWALKGSAKYRVFVSHHYQEVKK